MHGQKEKFVIQNTGGPSGADYSGNYYALRRKAPVYTIKSAKYNPEKDKTGEYVGPGTTLDGPVYSMKARPSQGIVYN
jgi:hypothetical protein